jgi:hypothetical protein
MIKLLAGVFLFVVSVSQAHAFEEKALKNLKAFQSAGNATSVARACMASS